MHEEGVYAAAGGGEEARRDGDPRGHADHHHRHRQEQARVRRRVRRRPPRVPPQTRALLLAGTRALASVALASLPRSLRLRRLAGLRAPRRQAVVRARYPRPRRLRARPEDHRRERGGRRRRGAGHALEHRVVPPRVYPRALRGCRLGVHLQAVEAGLWRRARGRRPRTRVRGGERRGGQHSHAPGAQRPEHRSGGRGRRSVGLNPAPARDGAALGDVRGRCRRIEPW